MKPFLRAFLFLSLIAVLLIACSGALPAATQTVLPPLTAYATRTPSPRPPERTLSVSPSLTLPVASPTPLLYTIQKGDTLLEIVRRYGVSLADLLAVNPGVRPEALTVGQVIQIPAPSPDSTAIPPAPVELGDVVCYRSGSGLYCFVPVLYSGEGWVENVIVRVTLLDAEGRLVSGQEALLPLDGLGAGNLLPAVAFFPRVESYTATQAKTLTALRVDGTQFLTVELRNVLVSVAWGGRWAQAEGQVWLGAEARPANLVRLAGVAYDAQGRVVGVRRWEGGALMPGSSLSFSFAVYSAGPPIARVEVLAEARP